MQLGKTEAYDSAIYELKALLVGSFGILVIIFPHHIKEYKAYEIGKKLTPEFIKIQRISGALLIVISLALIIVRIK